jgi:hypothetical protein
LKSISDGQFAFSPSHEFSLLTSLMEVESLTHALADLKWMFCVLPETEDDLFIGDHPVLIEDVGSNVERGSLGVLNPNIEIILPLGRRMAAVANRWCKPCYGTFEPGMSKIINQRTLLWVERFVYAGCKSEHLMDEAIKHHKHGPQINVERFIIDGAERVKFERK